MTDRYTLISADCHAGANIDTYMEYLDPAFRQAATEWRGAYKNPFRDLQGDGRTRNWDDERRWSDLHADGTVAEVLFPNTVPPFFPTGALVARPPTAADLDQRWAGLRAHNRWLKDWCDRYPGTRAGIGQVFLNDVDLAVDEARWIADAGLMGGILIPAIPDDCDLEPLYSPSYDPLWKVCEERGLVVNCHAGSGHPDYGPYPAASMMFAVETDWYAHRPLWQMLFGGVFERFPAIKFVLSEQGCDWLPRQMKGLDLMHQWAGGGRTGELRLDKEAYLPLKPSEYFERNVWLGVAFPRPTEARAMRKIGLHKVMWGSDYPHAEGTAPHTRLNLRRSFHDWDQADLEQVLSGTAAEVYGFDRDALAPMGAEFGPTVEELREPYEGFPEGSMSPGFF